MRTLLLALAGTLAIGGVKTGMPEYQWTADTTVSLKTFQFRPGTVDIRIGTRVTWSNGDEIEHTVTAGIPDSATGGFNGTLPKLGSAFAHTFTRAGTFLYYCDRHHFMRGEIRVHSGEN